MDSPLMQDQLRRPALLAGDKSNPRTERLQEILLIRLRKDFELRLTGRLTEQTIFLPGDLDGKVRIQSVGPYIAVQGPRVDANAFPLRSKHYVSAQRQDAQVICDLLRSRATDIPKHDYGQLRFRIVGQHGIEAFNSSAMFDNFRPILSAHRKTERVSVLKWRCHLLEGHGRKDLSTEQSSLPAQQVPGSRVKAPRRERNSHV